MGDICLSFVGLMIIVPMSEINQTVTTNDRDSSIPEPISGCQDADVVARDIRLLGVVSINREEGDIWRVDL